MQSQHIIDVTQTTKGAAGDLPQETGPAMPQASDVNWFSAQLQQPAQAPDKTNNIASEMLGRLAEHSDTLKNLAERAARDMQTASRVATPEAMLKATRSQSSFYLESLVTAKVLSKSSQALEKLTNLQ